MKYSRVIPRIVMASAAIFTASAANALSFTVDSCDYSVVSTTDKTARLTGLTDKNKIRNLIVPDEVTYEGTAYKVVAVGEAVASYSTSLRTVSIGKNVTTIDNDAFLYCTAVTQFTIPDGIRTIGSQAFYECSRATGLRIPSSVTSLGHSAFAHCPITEISIPSAITELPMYIFSNCDKLEKVTLPNTITKINSSAFNKCYALKTLTLPYRLTTLGNEVFNQCTGLTTIYLPSTLTTMGKSVFANCSALTKVNIPTKMTAIPDNAFQGCSALTEATLHNAITSIGVSAFSGCAKLSSTGLTAILPSSLSKLGKQAFLDCKALTSVSIPSKLTTVPMSAFSGCSALTSVQLGSATSIAAAAFSGCTALTEITLPTNFKTLNANAFNGCTALKKVNLNSQLTTIGKTAFSSCTALEQIDIPASVTSIGEGAFQGASSLQSIEVNAANTKYKSIAGVLYQTTPQTLLAYPAGRADKSFTVADGTLTIGKDALKGCLPEEVVFPSSVETLGLGALSQMPNLSTLDLGEGLKTIQGNYSLDYCPKLTQLRLPASLTKIEANVFYAAESDLDTYLTDIYCDGEVPAAGTATSFISRLYSTTKVHVPAGTLSAYQAAEPWKNFENITDVTIPTGVGEIDATEAVSIEAVYGLDGARIAHPAPGRIYIVRYSDGSVRKQILK